MRILQLLSQMQPTGAEAYALTISDWLTREGHEVFIASDRLHSEVAQKYIPLAVHDNRLRTRLQSTLFLRGFLTENKIQVIHCHSRAAARLAYWATLGKKIAVVSTLHGRQVVSLSKRIHDIFGDKCISICENLTEQVVSTLGMNPRKVRLIRNPMNTIDLPFTEILPKELRIAWIGRFTGPKGQRAQNFIQHTLPVLLEMFPLLKVDIIGGESALLGSAANDEIQRLQRLYSNRVQVENYRADLEKELGNYQLVFAAGRIAISSLLRGIPTFAIGEYSSEGLLTVKTVATAMRSNFGDIGSDGLPMTQVDESDLLRQVITALKQPSLSTEERHELRQIITAQFDRENVCRKIFNTYKSAYFLKHEPRWMPILMYHKIPNENLDSKHRIFVTTKTFESHLRFFQKKGFTTLHFSDLEDFRSGRKDFSQFPKKPLILTFDDGYTDNLENAGPLLKKYDFKAVIYLLADHTLPANFWDLDGDEPSHQLMGIEQKRQLKDFNFEIGSHGFRHQKITKMTEPEARKELRESKATLEKDFGGPVMSFAFTYGVTTAEASEWAEEEGYTFSLNTDTGGLHLEENPFAIFRANIFPEDGPTQLAKKTARWYRRYFHFKRGR